MSSDEITAQLTRIADALTALAPPKPVVDMTDEIAAQIEAARIQGEEIYARRKAKRRARDRARKMTTRQITTMADTLTASGRPDLAKRLHQGVA